MRFYKFQIMQSASMLAANYNGMVEPEEAPMLESERNVIGEPTLTGDDVSLCCW